jgi:hypothetical protein
MPIADIFFYSNSKINVRGLIERNAIKDLKPTNGYLTNSFGVLIDPKFFGPILKGREGTIEDIPIPSNWHADMAEFAAALRAIELACDYFTMIELGCGWGCWMNITGMVAKRKGLNVHLIGVEGDERHLSFAKESLNTNGFEPTEYTLHRGIASASNGTALFPTHNHPGAGWGAEPKFNLQPEDAEKLINMGLYEQLTQLTPERISDNFQRIDLLHIDIQGGEAQLITECISFFSDRVAYLVIGTHSRQIEGILFDCLLKAGWDLEIERPALLNLDPRPVVTVDGVQGWRNPKLLPKVDIADTKGFLRIISEIKQVKSRETFYLSVEISNQSSTDWFSHGEHPVHIAYHWLDIDGNVVTYDGERTKLPELELLSGQIKQQVVKFVAPSSSGFYRIILTAVQEGICWFEPPNFKGETRSIMVITD